MCDICKRIEYARAYRLWKQAGGYDNSNPPTPPATKIRKEKNPCARVRKIYAQAAARRARLT